MQNNKFPFPGKEEISTRFWFVSTSFVRGCSSASACWLEGENTRAGGDGNEKRLRREMSLCFFSPSPLSPPPLVIRSSKRATGDESDTCKLSASTGLLSLRQKKNIKATLCNTGRSNGRTYHQFTLISYLLLRLACWVNLHQILYNLHQILYNSLFKTLFGKP